MILLQIVFAIFPFQPAVLDLLEGQERPPCTSLSELERLTLQPGDRLLVIAPLQDSFEQQTIASMGYEAAPALRDYRHAFRQQRLRIEYLEIEQNLAQFQTLLEVEQWIRDDIAPLLNLPDPEKELFIKSYFKNLQTDRWIYGDNGQLGFLYKQLIALVFKA